MAVRRSYGLRGRQQGEDQAAGPRLRHAGRHLQDGGEGRHAPRCRYRSCDRILSQRPVERLQDQGDGIDPALWAQFWPLEDALRALGIAVWAMEELTKTTIRWSARITSDGRVRRCWTPIRLQCDARAMDGGSNRKTNVIRNHDGVRAKFGVDPERIPDYLALVGDHADGYPGIDGIGPKGAAGLIARPWPDRGLPAAGAR